MMMHQEALPVSYLGTWAKLNGIEFNGIQASPLSGMKGSGLLATTNCLKYNAPLIIIPKELVLSQETVWLYAKSDRQLKQVLEAVGDYSKVNGYLMISHILTKGRD